MLAKVTKDQLAQLRQVVQAGTNVPLLYPLVPCTREAEKP